MDRVYLADCNGENKQKWTAQPVGSGFYKEIINTDNGECLDEEWPCKQSSNQQWKFDGPNIILSDGKCLDNEDEWAKASSCGVVSQQWTYM